MLLNKNRREFLKQIGFSSLLTGVFPLLNTDSLVFGKSNLPNKRLFFDSEDDILKSVKLGSGFDCFKAAVKAQALQTTNQTTNTKAPEFEQDFKSIETITELLDILDLSVDFSVSVPFFSADAHISYLNKVEFNSYDFLAIAYLKIRLPSLILNNDQLTAQAQKEAALMTKSQFYDKYGDAWVSRVDYGGNFFGLLHVRCQTTAQKSSLKTDLTTSGFGASLDVKVSEMHSKMQKVGKVEILLKTTGGDASFVELKDFNAALKKFPNDVKNSEGAPVSIQLAGYEQSDWNDIKKQTEFSKAIRPARSYILQALNVKTQAEKLIKDGNYIIANNAQFDFSDGITVPSVTATVKDLQKISDAAKTKMDEIAKDPLSSTPMSSISFAEVKYPNRKNIPPPHIWTQVGVFNCCERVGDEQNWAGAFGNGNKLDSFFVRKGNGVTLDLVFTYTGKFVQYFYGAKIKTEKSGTNGNYAKCDTLASLLGVRILLAGNDAYLFDVCYKFHLKDGNISSLGVNGTWIETTEDNAPDGLLVYLRVKQ